MDVPSTQFHPPELETGTIYFVDEPRADLLLKVFGSMQSHGHQGLFITRMAPKKIRATANFENVPLIWLSTTPTSEVKTIDPSSISRLYSTVLGFMSSAKQPVVLLDGLDFLIFVNSYNHILRMLHTLYEKIVLTEGILLLGISRPTLTQVEWSLLTKDMVEIPPISPNW